ncbi:MAG TPA: NAD(P)H-binding protein [Sphingomonas sp.]|nr:NAD(P)H-binding protein [Sphingomonas sp.]
MKVVVIGGTGLVGSKLVEQLGQAGHAAIAAARSTGVDTTTGAGLDAVLDGADAVVDASNPGYADPAEMLRFFELSSRTLLAAEKRAEVRHHIVFSAIGTGRVTGGYYRAKDVQEALVARSGIPFTIVRSAPLFEYIYDAFDADRAAEAVRVPSIRIQPIAADDAAAELLRLLQRPPVNAVVEVAGPNIYQLPSLAQQILTAKDDYRPVVTDGDATFFGARMTGEALTGGAEVEPDSISFQDWLRRSLAPA